MRTQPSDRHASQKDPLWAQAATGDGCWQLFPVRDPDTDVDAAIGKLRVCRDDAVVGPGVWVLYPAVGIGNGLILAAATAGTVAFHAHVAPGNEYRQPSAWSAHVNPDRGGVVGSSARNARGVLALGAAGARVVDPGRRGEPRGGQHEQEGCRGDCGGCDVQAAGATLPRPRYSAPASV